MVLRQVDDNDEKESAFDGICNALELNPQAALPVPRVGLLHWLQWV
jgi:hypothetical protein